MNKKHDDPTLASLVGKSLALVQFGIDKAAGWGFRKMKEVSKQPSKPPKAHDNPVLHKAAKAGKFVLRFLGSAGEEFYKSYDELKRNEKSGGK